MGAAAFFAPQGAIDHQADWRVALRDAKCSG
jgi:hypothetical protein